MRILLVTGASRGIGAEIARAASREGWSVCVNYRNSKEDADDVIAQIHHSGGKAISVQADVGIDEEVSEMFKIIDRDLGSMTGLVNNAGINGNSCRVDELDASGGWVNP